ncbi:MAG: hypothetical protein QM639_07255 [Rhodocyclaceae bacterium]
MMPLMHTDTCATSADADWLARNQWTALRRMQRCLQADAVTRAADLAQSFALPATEAADRLART